MLVKVKKKKGEDKEVICPFLLSFYQNVPKGYWIVTTLKTQTCSKLWFLCNITPLFFEHKASQCISRFSFYPHSFSTQWFCSTKQHLNFQQNQHTPFYSSQKRGTMMDPYR